MEKRRRYPSDVTDEGTALRCCVGQLVRALRGACCRRTFRHGKRCIGNSMLAVNGRTLHSSCERGPRTGYGGDKRKRASKVHMAVNTLGHWLAVHVTPVNEQARAQVPLLAQEGQLVSGQSVKLAFAD